MSRPPVNPEKTAAGISVDPQTLERIVPESRRPDGSVRKQIKIRPGFTPQEDVRRFRSTRQQQVEANVLPKGHIIGWVPPSPATQANASTKSMTKSAKKNAKRKEKRAEKKQGGDAVPESWDDDEEEAQPDDGKEAESTGTSANKSTTKKAETSTDGLSEKLEKLTVKES